MTAKKILQNSQGQAMVEFVIVSLALVVLLVAIQFVCDAYVIKQKTIVAARYGTWKLAQNKNASRVKIEENINKYFFVNDKKITLTGGSKSSSGLVDGTLDFANKMFTGSGHSPLTAQYEVKYSRALQLSPFLESMKFPTTLTITSNHEVDGNCWNFDNTDVHEGWKLMISGIEGVFNALSF